MVIITNPSHCCIIVYLRNCHRLVFNVFDSLQRRRHRGPAGYVPCIFPHGRRQAPDFHQCLHGAPPSPWPLVDKFPEISTTTRYFSARGAVSLLTLRIFGAVENDLRSVFALVAWTIVETRNCWKNMADFDTLAYSFSWCLVSALRLFSTRTGAGNTAGKIDWWRGSPHAYCSIRFGLRLSVWDFNDALLHSGIASPTTYSRTWFFVRSLCADALGFSKQILPMSQVDIVVAAAMFTFELCPIASVSSLF